MTKAFSLIGITLLLAGCTLFAPQNGTDADTSASSSSVDAMEDPSQDDAMMEEGTEDSMMEDDDTMMEEDTGSEDAMMEEGSSSSETSVAAQAVYTAYADGVLANGETKLLFFHASWCPFCIKSDAVLNELYGAEDLTHSTYKIDYDTATQLRSQYGIVTQDTFVLVDGTGAKVSEILHPTPDQLRDLLQ